MNLRSKKVKTKMKSMMKTEYTPTNMNFMKKSKMMVFIPTKKETTSSRVGFVDRSRQPKRRNGNGNFLKESALTTIT